MSLKKTVAIAATAGALAALAVPAMALENEFHGIYNFNTTFSNFQAGGSGDFAPATIFSTTAPVLPATVPSVVSNYGENRKMNNYFEQRARLQYTAKVNDDLKLVTHFELDARFGNQSGGPNAGADLDTDEVTLETKHVYLDFNLGKNFNTKLGLQPYQDTIKGVFISADVPAIMTTSKFGAYTLGVGFSRFDDDAATLPSGQVRLGDKNKDLFILDNTFAFSKDTKAAFSYYLLADYAAGSTGYSAAFTPNGSNILETTGNGDAAILLNTFALSGETKAGPATLSGFAAMQAGHQKYAPSVVAGQARRYFHGWAANAAAKMAAGPGTARAAFLFTSGNNSTDPGSYKGWVTSSVNTYNEGGMMILARSTANSPSTTDTYIRRNVTNLALLTLGYDANLTEKIFLNANVGFGWAPSSEAEQHLDLSNVPLLGDANYNGSDFMGTEVNLEAGYKVFDNLTLKASAAYMMLGGYYKNSALKAGYVNGNQLTYIAADPENPYSMRLHAQFKF